MRKKAGVILLLAAVAIAGSKAIQDRDYCDITCDDGYGNIYKHTLCIYSAEASEKKCEQLGYKDVKRGLTQEEKDIVVKMHNEFRQKVASGKETRGYNNHGQPAAKEMKEIQWDDDLEYVAQRLANQCQSELNHDKCRSRSDGQSVGQNLAQGWGSRGYPLEKLINGWIDEVQYYDGNNAYKIFDQMSNPTGTDLGHYTQMVNAKTDRIGCGAVRYTKGNLKYFDLYCNYSPAGNSKYELIYEPIDFDNKQVKNSNNNQRKSWNNNQLSNSIDQRANGNGYYKKFEYPNKSNGIYWAKPNAQPSFDRPNAIYRTGGFPKRFSTAQTSQPSSDLSDAEKNILSKLTPGQSQPVTGEYKTEEGNVKETITYTVNSVQNGEIEYSITSEKQTSNGRSIKTESSSKSGTTYLF